MSPGRRELQVLTHAPQKPLGATCCATNLGSQEFKFHLFDLLTACRPKSSGEHDLLDD